MRSVSRRLAWAAASALVFAPAPLLAEGTTVAAKGGLQVVVRASDATAPTVVVTNLGATACRVATTSTGTLTLTRVEQDGQAISPIIVPTSFDDDLGTLLTMRLGTIAPGESQVLPLQVVPLAPTGQGLRTVEWSATGPSFTSIYPIRTGRPLSLDVTYAMPVQVDDKPPLCAPGSSVSAGTTDRSLPGWVPWAILAGVILVALVVFLVARRPGRATAIVLVAVMGASATQLWLPRTAQATIVFDPKDAALANRWAECAPILLTHDPANIMPTLQDPKFTLHLVNAKGSPNGEYPVGRDAFVLWNPNEVYEYPGDPGVFSNPCTALYHEFYHAYQDARGEQDQGECVTIKGRTGIPKNEVYAIRAENLLRAALKLPLRTTYGRLPLPDSDCVGFFPPPPKQCPNSGCADSNGDTHLLTFDGLRYDFQAVGEFVATRDSAGGFEIQVRQQPVLGSRVAAVNSAVAMDVAGDRVEVDLVGARIGLLVGGAPRPLEASTLPRGGSLTPPADPRESSMTVSWPDGSTATVSAIGPWGLHLVVEAAKARAGRLTGLLGDLDGDPANDLRLRDGRPVSTPPRFEALYPGFADSWRVSAQASLFTYSPGSSAETYTDRTFPDRPVRVDQLPSRAAAEGLCRRLGVTDPDVLRDCTLDVAVTGRPEFALAARAGLEFAAGRSTAPITVDGPPATLSIVQPGARARYTFDGHAGERIFVDIPSTTLPNQCYIGVAPPEGNWIASGCVLSGSGFIDGAVTLPVSGRYAVEIIGQGQSTGQATVRITSVTDQVGTIAVNGPPVVADIARPGEIAHFRFAGTAGQTIHVDVSNATLPDQCFVVGLAPAGKPWLTSGCILSGRGSVAAFTLPSSGDYLVEVHPAGRNTGRATLRLLS